MHKSGFQTPRSDGFECMYCQQNFLHEDELEERESEHLAEPTYNCWQCTLCRRRFHQSFSLEQHIHSKHGNVECRFCRMRKEKSIDDQSGEHFCGDCDKSFADVLAFLQHDQAAHVSCQKCEQVGRRKNKEAFDRHCCGCYTVLKSEEEVEEHLARFADHYHEHPNFRPKGLDNLNPFSNRRTSVLGPPSTPPAVWSSRHRRSRSNSRSPQHRLLRQVSAVNPLGIQEDYFDQRQNPRSTPARVYQCVGCRTCFTREGMLQVHQQFNFGVMRNCRQSFSCPIVLLRHIESGECCEWLDR